MDGQTTLYNGRRTQNVGVWMVRLPNINGRRTQNVRVWMARLPYIMVGGHRMLEYGWPDYLI